MHNRHAKLALQRLLTGIYFFAGCRSRKLGEAWVGLSVRAYLLAGIKPVPHLPLIHQRFNNVPGLLLPFVGFPNERRYQKLDAPKLMSLHRRQGVFEYILKAIIERQKDY